MKRYRADLHIHSVLSPCGDLSMSPVRIIDKAIEKKIDILGISDHNSTKHAEVMIELGLKKGIKVLPGVEINTQEEVHCLAFFESMEKCKHFQDFLDRKLLVIENVTSIFGHQVVVDAMENILEEEKRLLISRLSADIQQVEKEVHQLGGLFIPAHVDRPQNSIFSQIGLIPEKLQIDAIEISGRSTIEEMMMRKPELKDYTIIRNSDAHQIDQIGQKTTIFDLEEPTFEEIKKALRGNEGRKVIIE